MSCGWRRCPVAKRTILLCDRCGREKDTSQTVLIVNDERMTSDLCASCLKSMLKEYHYFSTIRSNKVMKVWDYDAIPRTGG